MITGTSRSMPYRLFLPDMSDATAYTLDGSESV